MGWIWSKIQNQNDPAHWQQVLLPTKVSWWDSRFVSISWQRFIWMGIPIFKMVQQKKILWHFCSQILRNQYTFRKQNIFLSFKLKREDTHFTFDFRNYMGLTDSRGIHKTKFLDMSWVSILLVCCQHVQLSFSDCQQNRCRTTQLHRTCIGYWARKSTKIHEKTCYKILRRMWNELHRQNATCL